MCSSCEDYNVNVYIDVDEMKWFHGPNKQQRLQHSFLAFRD